MTTPETSREPCPDRIIDDVGGAFGMGAVGGSAFHFLKGMYNSPNGQRLSGATTAVRLNAPRVGGSFAVWGGLFSTFDCTMVYLRQKEDPWNSILAGAATGGFLAMRQGLRPAAKSAAFGGVLLALIEGAGIMLNKLTTEQQNQLPPFEEPNVAVNGLYRPEGHVAEQPAGNSWFGMFGGGKNKDDDVEGRGSGAKTEVLESFDAPSAPIPKF